MSNKPFTFCFIFLFVSCAPKTMVSPNDTLITTSSIITPLRTIPKITNTSSKNNLNEINECIQSEIIHDIPPIDGKIVTFENSNNIIELWDLLKETNIQLGRTEILSGVNINNNKITLIDADEHKLKIIDPEGIVNYSKKVPETWVQIIDWDNLGRLLIGNMPHRTTGGWDPPSSTVIYELNNGQIMELFPKYPNIYIYAAGPPNFGYYSYSLTAYDPSLTRVLFPAETKTESYISLFDIPNQKELTRIYTPFPFTQVRWNTTGTYFIISAPPYYKDYEGRVFNNSFDDAEYIGGNELFIADRDGHMKRLTFITTKLEVIEYSFSWSPDNENVAFWMVSTKEKNKWDLVILNITTGKLKCFSSIHSGSLPIIWSSDGKKIISTISNNSLDYELIYIDIEMNKSITWTFYNKGVIGWINIS